jgi:hypothetical protein
MSALSRKHAAEADTTGTRGRIPQAARPTVLARAAVPMAKTAGLAARDGARNAAAWAAPGVGRARAWTAPRIERSGLVIKDTIAPKICQTLTAAARRVDVTAPPADVIAPRRRWPRAVAGTAVLAAAGAAAAAMLRRRKHDRICAEPVEAADGGAGPQIAQDGQPRADAGRSGEEDVSRRAGT